MGFQGRSLDDLPLAAYTTGVAPDEDESLDSELDPDLVAPPAPTQQELAAALADSVAAAAAPPEKKNRGPRPSLKLPSLRRSKAAALQQAAPFQPVAAGAGAGAVAPAASYQAVQAVSVAAPALPVPKPAALQAAAAVPASKPAAFQAAPAFEATPAFEPVTGPAAKPQRGLPKLGLPKPGLPQPGQPKAGAPGAARRGLPRLSLRDPRVLAGGVIVVGVALLGVSLLGGGGPASGSTGANASQDTAAFVPTPAPGNASVELTGSLAAMYTLTSATGAGPAVGSQVDATWTDALGESLGITGLASQGTRTTDPTFSLSWTMLINGQAVTFTSRAKECTIGMAVGPKAVHGTFVCKQLKSGDGKHEIDMRGTYTT